MLPHATKSNKSQAYSSQAQANSSQSKAKSIKLQASALDFDGDDEDDDEKGYDGGTQRKSNRTSPLWEVMEVCAF
jgi:hypothetical protein